MSTPVPALPPPALEWLPGLREADLAGLPIVIGDERQKLPKLECRHVILHRAARGFARRAGPALIIGVAAGDEAFATALIAAYARPGQPAAADPASASLLALARRVGASPASVLIEGATGTGKEGLARLVHQASPPPRCAPRRGQLRRAR